MKISIKRIDTTVPLPIYHTEGAVAFDLAARETTVIPPRSVARIPTNVVIEVPKGYLLYIKDRSSTIGKKGLLATAGIVDQDYCGDTDEVLFQVYNLTDMLVTVERGERIAQGMFLRVERADWDEVPHMENKNRGGFGTTG